MLPKIIPLAANQTSAIVQLLAESLPAEHITPERFARHILLDPNFDTRAALVATENDQPIGFIYAGARQQPLDATDARRGYVTVIAVAESHRRRGVGTALLAAAEARLRQLGRSEVLISPYAPAYFTPGIDLAAYPAAVSFFADRGYEEVTRPISMRCELRPLTVPPFVPAAAAKLRSEGVTIEPFTPSLTRPVLDFALTEFGRDWEIVYRDAIGQILRRQAEPTRVFVAHADHQVLGITHHDADRFGPIGVAAAARHRRIGQVLMYQTLQAQRAAGHESAYFLWTDDRTADRLYRGAGFVEVRRFVILRKHLATIRA